MAQLQQLDPTISPDTPQQLTQVLQQKHQQLRTLQQQVKYNSKAQINWNKTKIEEIYLKGTLKWRYEFFIKI